MLSHKLPGMQEVSSSSWVRVTRPEAVALLDDDRLELLAPFFEGAVGVAEAARRAKVSLDRMAYFVEQAVRFGLLRLERVEKRKGRPIKRYRTTGEVFFVSFKDVPATTLEEHVAASEARATPDLAAAAAKSLHRFADDGAWGRAYFLSEDGPTRMTASPRYGVTTWEAYLEHLLSDKAPPYLLIRQPLKLAPEEAKALQRDLVRLLQRYEKHGEESARTYYLKIFLAEAP